MFGAFHVKAVILISFISHSVSLPHQKADSGDVVKEGIYILQRSRRQVQPQGNFKGYEIPQAHTYKGYNRPLIPQTTVPPPMGLPPLPPQPLRTTSMRPPLPLRRRVVTTTLPPCTRRVAPKTTTTTILPPCPTTPAPCIDQRTRSRTEMRFMQNDSSSMSQRRKTGFRHYSTFQRLPYKNRS